MVPVLHSTAHGSMQIQTTVGLHEGALCTSVCRWECACNGSQQQTRYWLHAFTHAHICYVGAVVRSCPWCYYLSSSTPVPTVHWCETTSSRGGRYSMWRCESQGFTEHICWRNKYRGERKIPSPKPRGFTPHSPALSTFFKSAGTGPPNSNRMCQTPVSPPKRTSQEGKYLLISLLACSVLSFSGFKKHNGHHFSRKKKVVVLACLANQFQQSQGIVQIAGYTKTNTGIHG